MASEASDPDPMFVGYTTAQLTEMRVTALTDGGDAERIEREIVRRHPTFAADLQGDSVDVIERWECLNCGTTGEAKSWCYGSARCRPDTGAHRHDVPRTKVEYVPASQLQGAVAPVSDAEVDLAWSAWTEAWVTASGREAMRMALAAFLNSRGGQ